MWPRSSARTRTAAASANLHSTAGALRQLIDSVRFASNLGRIALFAFGAGRQDEAMRRCNHCDGQLGLIIHRKWKARFCSKACKEAYEQKLDEERAKLRHLAFLAQGPQTNYWAEPLEYPRKT